MRHMMPVIFRPGLKYTIRQAYTVSAVAALVAACTCVGAYRSISWVLQGGTPAEGSARRQA